MSFVLQVFFNKFTISPPQVKVAQQDDRPVMGTRKSLVVKTTVTYELPTPTPTPLYFYGPQTRQYHIPDHTFTVPDTGVVPVQVDIPDNATNINLNVIIIIIYHKFWNIEDETCFETA